MTSGIYAIVSPSGKRYIGSAVNIEKRWHTHRAQLRKGAHHNEPLQRAYDKYGLDALAFTVLQHCEKADLITLEQAHIDECVAGELYNTCPQAGSRLGYKHTEKAIAKMRDAMTDERRKAISAISSGKRPSSETLARMSQAQGNRSQEWRDKLSNSQKGKVISDAIRARMSEARCTSGFPGVSLFKRTGKWMANARIDRKQVHLGYFDSAELANAYRLYYLTVQGLNNG